MRTTCSVIIINYNTAEMTAAAVRSILQKTVALKPEIIVVDNGSEPADFDLLQKELSEIPTVSIVRSRINTGFGGGNMLGVQKATGKYYAFINSDTNFLEDALSPAVDFLENEPNSSLVGGIAVREDGRPYRAFLYGLSLRNELIGPSILHQLNPSKYPSRKKVFKEPTKVDAVSGSFMVIKAADFDILGGFDSNLFLYYEEKDLAFRIKKVLKKDVYLLPHVRYVHFKGKSSSDSLALKKELKISKFYSIRKNLGAFKFCIFYTYSLIIFLLKAPFKKKNRKDLGLIFRGVSLAESLKHQQKIQPVDQVSHE